MTDHDAYLTRYDALDGLYKKAKDGPVTMNRLQISLGEHWALSIEATDDGELEVTRV